MKNTFIWLSIISIALLSCKKYTGDYGNYVPTELSVDQSIKEYIYNDKSFKTSYGLEVDREFDTVLISGIKAKYVIYKNIALEYTPDTTEIQILIRSNAVWYAPTIKFVNTSTQAMWAACETPRGGGDAIARIKAMQGATGSGVRSAVAQMIHTNDSTKFYEFRFTRRGRTTP